MFAARIRWAVATALVASVAMVVHAATTATVQGVEALNVRAAPNLASPPFLALPKGSKVSVDRVADGWAAITLASGRQGYVKAVYLDLPRDGEPAAVVDAPIASAPATAATAPPMVEGHGDGGRTEVLERELVYMRERLAALESAVASPAPTSPARADQSQPGSLVGEQRPTHVAGALLPTMAAEPDPQSIDEIGPSLALAGVGLIVGFLIGTIYGRRQERTRRSRVRF